MKLYANIENTRRAHWDAVRATIGTKAVLLVEGEDDQRSIEAALTALQNPATGDVWPARLAIVPLGGEELVRRTLRDGHLPGQSERPLSGAVLALLDRDQRTHQEVAALEQAHSGRLFLTPGWALENLFFDQTLMRGALARLTPTRDIESELENARPAWVRAAMRYAAIQQLQDTMNEALKPLIKLKAVPESIDADPEALMAALEAAGEAAHHHIAPLTVVEKIVMATERALALSAAEQWGQVVDGKQAFRQLLSGMISGGLKAARPAFDQVLHQHAFIQDLCRKLSPPRV